jgi:hypothetical protein
MRDASGSNGAFDYRSDALFACLFPHAPTWPESHVNGGHARPIQHAHLVYLGLAIILERREQTAPED